MGKQPRMLAPTESQVEVVACHPRQEVVAVGYADGLVLLVRIDDGAEILAKKPGDAPVTALAWDAAGDAARVRHGRRRGRRSSASATSPRVATCALGCACAAGAGSRRGLLERVVGQPVPDLAAAEQRDAEVAAHLELAGRRRSAA